MFVFVAVIASLAFIGWVIYRAARKKEIKAHLVMYGLSCLAGICTLTFFLSMDVSKMVKILVCILLGSALIFLAAWLQRRAQAKQP